MIESDDGPTIMFEWHGYGRAYPPGRRQIVGAVFHLSDAERYRRLNDAVCVCVGEVRASSDPQQEPDLVLSAHQRGQSFVHRNIKATLGFTFFDHTI